jgi:putative redox protein
MVAMTVLYQGALRCTATHGPSGTQIETDAPRDNHGLGERFSPTDLVATALGACMLTIMGIAARTLEIPLEGASVTVTKEMVQSPVRRIGALRVVIAVTATGLNDAQKQKLEQAALTCPVHQSLHTDIKLPIEFQWA